MRSFVKIIGFCALLSTSIVAQTGFVNYESSLTHPIRLSPDGSRLFVVNAPNGKLEVWSTANPDAPLLLAQIPVGQEPVSVTPRSNDEAWVVNNLSDSISIVSVAMGRVIGTIRVKDEPQDVVFAGTPERAYVSVCASDQVRVFDPTTRAQVASIAIAGKDPRALAKDPTGQKVYVLVHRSGNKTTVIDQSIAPPPPAPTNMSLPAAPQQGLIVSSTDPMWSGVIPFTLPDNDVAEITTSTNTVARYFTSVGTILFDLAVDPSNGDLFVAGIESRNLVRFEPVIKGHAIDSRLTKITTGVSPVVSPFDLNPGINYSLFPNPSALATALAEPTAVVWGPGVLYVAAQGTDRIGVVNTAGTVTARIDLGSTNTLTKKGPRGLAYNAATNRLYVHNRMSASFSIIDTTTNTVVAEKPFAHDPTPQAIKDGRKFLYDTKLSGNGTMSCASCHIDGDIDMVAWDLGDPAGSLAPTPLQPFPFNAFLQADFHPMKGPMTTQTLRGLSGIAPLHWRGDRATLADFNPAFGSLLGGTPLGATDLALFVGFMEAIAFPPNPNQNLDRTLVATPTNNNAQEGFNVFVNTLVNSLGGLTLTCATCHSIPEGTNDMVIAGLVIQAPQGIKTPHLRNAYRKTGMTASGQAKAGFGFTHDGAIPTVAAFLAKPVFVGWPSNKKDDLATFVNAFDTGTAPTVGYDVHVDAATASLPATVSDIATLEAQAIAGNCDVTVKGMLFGLPRGLVYDAGTGLYSADDLSLGTFTWSALQTLALGGQAVLTFTGVAPGTGVRIGVDQDADGATDGADGLVTYGTPMTGAGGTLVLSGNREPKIGEAGFALVASGAPAGGIGFLSFSSASAVIPINSLTAYIDVFTLDFFSVLVFADGDRIAAYPAPLPPDPNLVGFTIYGQAFFYDPNLPDLYYGSNGLAMTVQN